MQTEYSFNLYNSLATSGTVIALKKMLVRPHKVPVIACIGSDLSVGDSLGPITGTLLKEKLRLLNCFIYGTLQKPITAHEIRYINKFLRQSHPDSPIIAIDAAVGSSGDIGLIKIANHGVKPGSGSNKKLGMVGDISVMGIIAEKSLFNLSILSSTRLNIVYRMANIIAEGISTFIMDDIRNSVLNQTEDELTDKAQ